MSNSDLNNLLVLVADGRKAILLRNDSSDDKIELREERRLSPVHLIDDGPSGSRPTEQTRRQTDEATFAKQLAETLYSMKMAGGFGSLIIVADPQTLGQLRDTMHKIVEQSIVRTLAKDLTNHSVLAISEAIQ